MFNYRAELDKWAGIDLALLFFVSVSAFHGIALYIVSKEGSIVYEHNLAQALPRTYMMLINASAIWKPVDWPILAWAQNPRGRFI